MKSDDKMEKKPADMKPADVKPKGIAKNRTGVATSPLDAKRTIEGAIEGGSTAPGGVEELAAFRAKLARLATTPVGTIPPPPTIFMDKLGERLAFERTGTRLYEALLVKLEKPDAVLPGGPTKADLRKIHDEELRHFDLVRSVIEELGADPTAMTPCADVAGVASAGILAVVTDARTTLAQALDAILIAELTDEASWDLLIELATGLGLDDIAKRLGPALETEGRHVDRVREWLAALNAADAGVEEAA